MPREQRDRIERMEELWGFLDQSHISDNNIRRLNILIHHTELEVREFAVLMLDIGQAYPYKRRRWRRMAGEKTELFRRAMALLGIEFFEEVLFDYGDTRGPLWRAVNAALDSDAVEDCVEQPPAQESDKASEHLVWESDEEIPF